MERVTLAQTKRTKFVNYFKKNWWLYMFVLPTIIWYIIFHYVPMGGIVIAFKRYNGVKTIWESKWVGLKWFESFLDALLTDRSIIRLITFTNRPTAAE